MLLRGDRRTVYHVDQEHGRLISVLVLAIFVLRERDSLISRQVCARSVVPERIPTRPDHLLALLAQPEHTQGQRNRLPVVLVLLAHIPPPVARLPVTSVPLVPIVTFVQLFVISVLRARTRALGPLFVSAVLQEHIQNIQDKLAVCNALLGHSYRMVEERVVARVHLEQLPMNYHLNVLNVLVTSMHQDMVPQNAKNVQFLHNLVLVRAAVALPGGPRFFWS